MNLRFTIYDLRAGVKFDSPSAKGGARKSHIVNRKFAAAPE